MTTEEKLEKLIAEIKRLKAYYEMLEEIKPVYDIAIGMADDLLEFIDSALKEASEEPKFKIGDRIKFKGVHNEDVIRVITDIKKCGDGCFRYFFADGSIYSIDDDGIEVVKEPVKIKKGCKYRCLSDMQNTDTGAISFFKDKIYLAPEDDTLVSEENGWLCDTSENSSNFELVEEPVSEDLEKAAEQDVCEVVNTCSATGIPNDHIPSWVQDAMINEYIHGANWQKQQLMKNVVLETEVLRDSDGDGVDTPYESWLTLANTEIPDLPESLGLEEGDKVKILIVKSE